MIVGKITSHEAILSLEVSGSNTVLRRIEAVIDTGYNGYLMFSNEMA
jgi:predicted aspartyl protease